MILKWPILFNVEPYFCWPRKWHLFLCSLPPAHAPFVHNHRGVFGALTCHIVFVSILFLILRKYPGKGFELSHATEQVLAQEFRVRVRILRDQVSLGFSAIGLG